MEVSQLLAVEAQGADSFLIAKRDSEAGHGFGGVTVARLLAAAAATAGEVPCHALQLLFLRPAMLSDDMRIDVDRLRDGGAFKARGVQAVQNGRIVASALASFHAGDAGPTRQPGSPVAPSPDSLEDQRETRRRKAAARGQPERNYAVENVLDIRSRDAPMAPGETESRRILWFRTRQALPDEASLHQAVIAMASDIGLVHVALIANNQAGRGPGLDTASLNHAIWFHRPARADDWLFFEQRSSLTLAGRGLSQGQIFDREGNLVASIAQEIMIRERNGTG